MTADIAHELRTPLAVQRANLEALQDGIYPLSQDNLAPIIQQNQLLTKLVDDLRTLAMADSGALDLEITPTDLSVLLARIAKDCAAGAMLLAVIGSLGVGAAVFGPRLWSLFAG